MQEESTVKMAYDLKSSGKVSSDYGSSSSTNLLRAPINYTAGERFIPLRAESNNPSYSGVNSPSFRLPSSSKDIGYMLSQTPNVGYHNPGPIRPGTPYEVPESKEPKFQDAGRARPSR